MNLYEMDKERYKNSRPSVLTVFLRLFRAHQTTKNKPLKILYKILMKLYKIKNCLEIPNNLDIGGGWYIGHPYCITINPKAKIGNMFYIHKGVTIGQENRGKRKGTPIIGDKVWIGVNATVVGNITIGNDVLIAPNSFVNIDIPSHSVVFGNPCIIKKVNNATEGYIHDNTEIC